METNSGHQFRALSCTLQFSRGENGWYSGNKSPSYCLVAWLWLMAGASCGTGGALRSVLTFSPPVSPFIAASMYIYLRPMCVCSVVPARNPLVGVAAPFAYFPLLGGYTVSISRCKSVPDRPAVLKKEWKKKKEDWSVFALCRTTAPPSPFTLPSP